MPFPDPNFVTRKGIAALNYVVEFGYSRVALSIAQTIVQAMADDSGLAFELLSTTEQELYLHARLPYPIVEIVEEYLSGVLHRLPKLDLPPWIQVVLTEIRNWNLGTAIEVALPNCPSLIPRLSATLSIYKDKENFNVEY